MDCLDWSEEFASSPVGQIWVGRVIQPILLHVERADSAEESARKESKPVSVFKLLPDV